ncbi:MAG: hypothetical protein IPP46_06550 [Bacteroidetes bacterium]|nr:hypothetical protein [Bacteroidota bacterium]
MRVHIIHLKHRKDRLQLLDLEIVKQNILNYTIWEGILDIENPKRGIAKAHKKIVEWARNQNLQSILIAEDDVKFTAPRAFEYFLQNEPKEYDLYLGGIAYGNINSDNSTDDFSGAHFYKINQKFYDIFLSVPEEKDIDRSLANKGKFIVCDPFIAVQQNGFSDNQKREQNYDLYLQNRRLFR